jgi:hypothetical protein
LATASNNPRFAYDAVAKPATKQKEAAKVADNKSRGRESTAAVAAKEKSPTKEKDSSSKHRRSLSWGSLAKKIPKPDYQVVSTRVLMKRASFQVASGYPKILYHQGMTIEEARNS